MSDEPELREYLTEEELRVSELLDQHRPPPPARFRGTLGRRLTALDPGWGPRPERLWTIALSYLSLGLVLIGLAALSGLGAV